VKAALPVAQRAATAVVQPLKHLQRKTNWPAKAAPAATASAAAAQRNCADHGVAAATQHASYTRRHICTLPLNPSGVRMAMGSVPKGSNPTER